MVKVWPKFILLIKIDLDFFILFIWVDMANQELLTNTHICCKNVLAKFETGMEMQVRMKSTKHCNLHDHVSSNKPQTGLTPKSPTDLWDQIWILGRYLKFEKNHFYLIFWTQLSLVRALWRCFFIFLWIQYVIKW